MPRALHFALVALAATPLVVFSAQTQTGPLAEQVYKDVKVFKGVPANDMIPAMEFMSAALKFTCNDCHVPGDYAADAPKKETARKMVEMQRELNTKFFNGRLEVTCNTCHHGMGHPEGTPLPADINLRHARLTAPAVAADIFAKHTAAVGKSPAMLTRSGSLTAPPPGGGEAVTKEIEFIQADGNRYRVVSGDYKFGSDGAAVWYGPNPLTDEPAAIFNRIGRAWRGDNAFAGLERLTVSGQEKSGEQIVVRGVRTASASTEELYFDAKTGLLARLVNIKRSTIGTVVSTIQYLNYQDIEGTKVPMKVVVTAGSGEDWIMEFKAAKVSATVDEGLFKIGG